MTRFDRAVVRWFFAPAYWWQFWRPGSGATGGLITFALALGFSVLIHACST